MENLDPLEELKKSQEAMMSQLKKILEVLEEKQPPKKSEREFLNEVFEEKS